MKNLFFLPLCFISTFSCAAVLEIDINYDDTSRNTFINQAIPSWAWVSGYNQRCAGNCPSTTTVGAKSGISQKFRLVRDSSQPDKEKRQRSEVINLGHFFDFDTEYWLGMDFNRIDWDVDSVWDFSPFQIHTQPSSYRDNFKCVRSPAYGNAPFMIISSGSTTRFAGWRQRTIGQYPTKTNQWENIVFHFVFSTTSAGYIEVFIDGVLIGSESGANHPLLDNCDEPVKRSYLQMGIYKWDWDTGDSDVSERQVLVDNLKIARGSNGYELVGGTTPGDGELNNSPVIVSMAPDKVLTENINYSWVTPAFSDPDGDTITYSSNAGDWLAFNPFNQDFFGNTPTAGSGQGV